MLHYNQLNISPDGKYLIIDVSVDRLSYFNNINIDSIVIDTQDTYVPNGPSNNPIYTYKASIEYDMTYSIPDNCNNQVKESENLTDVYTLGSRNIRLLLTAKDLTVPLNTTMFFVYAIASGTPSPDTPCGMDINKILGTAIDTLPIYLLTINYMKELDEECKIPKHFIDMILKLKALDLSIKTGNYIQAIKYWNKFFKTPINLNINKCGCYG